MRKIKWFVHIFIGTLLMGISYKSIFDSVGMVTGGFSGLSIILKEVFGIPLWLSMVILNVPVFAIALRVNGKEFVKGTMVATSMLTVFLGILPDLSTFFMEEMQLGDNLLLASVFGGVIGGLGIGLVISSSVTTGGTDLIATILHKFIPHYSIVQIMQALDAMIVVLGGAVFGLEKSLYAIMSIYVITKVSDWIVDGTKSAKALYVISDNYEQISEKILGQLDRGGTFLEGRGMYSGDRKNVIMCVTSKKEAVKLKKIVWETDPDAFIIISDVREAWGEGFVENRRQ